MIAYKGSGYYAILVVEKVLIIFYYSIWGPEEAWLGTPFVVNSEKEFWDCVVYVIEDKFS